MARNRFGGSAAAPWLLAGVWNVLDRHGHLVDRLIRALTVRRG